MSKRGRPRQFDENAVSDALMGVFWRKGYGATSLDELAAATGLNRPSLYSAFGNKLDMYVLSLRRFTERVGENTGQHLAAAATFEDALNGFYATLIDMYVAGPGEEGGLGCLIFSNAVSEAPNNAVIQSEVNSILIRVQQVFSDVLTAHHPDCPAETREIALDLALSTFLGLGTRIRA
ncbi:MAG: TetR/AcrR family transcriptional regulator, partial [Pseudomonadota bacterium]